jgi:hypothetical protein
VTPAPIPNLNSQSSDDDAIICWKVLTNFMAEHTADFLQNEYRHMHVIQLHDLLNRLLPDADGIRFTPHPPVLIPSPPNVDAGDFASIKCALMVCHMLPFDYRRGLVSLNVLFLQGLKIPKPDMGI